MNSNQTINLITSVLQPTLALLAAHNWISGNDATTITLIVGNVATFAMAHWLHSSDPEQPGDSERPSVSVSSGKTALMLLVAAGLAAVAGCALFTPGAQKAEYTTIASLETTATASVNGYYTLVANGTVSTNGVPVVARMYNQFQADCTLAAALAEAGTNAVATTNLTTELQELSTIISTLKD
ncbi:MAG: hypothetical protein KGL39_08620 [Patescibacteria group bacterium]|nr:hypothetical protein [Patescibacteria group bacterium]